MVASFSWGRGSDSSAGRAGLQRCRGHCLGEPSRVLSQLAGPRCPPSPLEAILSPLVDPLQDTQSCHTRPCPRRLRSPARHRPPAQTVAADLVRSLAWSGHRCWAGPVRPPHSPSTFREPGAWALQQPRRPASSGFEDWRLCSKTPLQRLPVASSGAPHPHPRPGPPLYLSAPHRHTCTAPVKAPNGQSEKRKRRKWRGGAEREARRRRAEGEGKQEEREQGGQGATQWAGGEGTGRMAEGSSVGRALWWAG